jgi:predicted ATPase
VFSVLLGKTSLVSELQKEILAQRGLFTSSKFDQLRGRDVNTLLNAFRPLCTQLLVQDAAMWRVKITRALGASAAVLCDLWPELLRLIGPQPPVATLSPAETSNRFNMCFLQFVACLATATSPLVLFVDDLQVRAPC